jgi:hypothetical protein
MAIPGFIYGGSTGETQDTLARKRKVAEALMIKGSMAPKNVGEGLSAIGNALLYRSLMKKLDSGEKSLSDNAAMDYNALFGGGASPTVTPGNSVADKSAPTSSIPMTDAAREIADSSSPDAAELSSILSDDARRSTLPAGMRNNNPGNIKFVGQKIPGIVGPSENTDQGDPQAVFDTPESGMAAMFSLAKRKYDGGKKSTNQLIAGNMGWTPGNTQAAANVARTMGLGPDDDINLNDPAMASRFMRALILQEHGKSGNLYPESMINRALGYGGDEVASLDPASGMPAAVERGAILSDPSQTAAGAIEQQAPLPVGESLADEAAAFRQTPEYAAQFPGQQVTPDPSVAAALAQPQADAGAALPSVPQQATAQQPQVNPQIAQALMAGDQSGVGMGGGAPGEGYFPAQPNQAAQSGPSMQQLMQAAANPNLNDGQRAVVNALLQRKMQEADPTYQMGIEKSRLELDAMKNPTPEWDFINGKDGSVFRADKRKGTMEQVYGGKPQVFRPLSAEEAATYGLPPGSNYQIGPDNKVSKIGGEGTTVNIDQKAEGAFDKKLAEKQAEAFDTMATEGLNARADLAVIDELSGLLQGTGGTLDGLSGALAKYGIGGEGISDIQAANALINKLVPSQRAPGSGSMSDRDVEMFRASLPSLWNAPGGNARILGVMKGLTEYKQGQGEIADQVLTGEMTRQEARRALRELPNPLDAFKKADEDAGKKPDEAQPTEIQPGQIEDGYLFKGGDRADPNNWEKVL